MNAARFGLAAFFLLAGAAVVYLMIPTHEVTEVPISVARRIPPGTPEKSAPSPAPQEPGRRVAMPESPPTSASGVPDVPNAPDAPPAAQKAIGPVGVEFDDNGLAINQFGEIEFADGVPVLTQLSSGEFCTMTATAIISSDGTTQIQVAVVITEPGSNTTVSAPRIMAPPGATVRIGIGDGARGFGVELTPKLKAN